MTRLDYLKCFAEVVSIDAWHVKNSDENYIAALHADLVFGTARVGGEDESQVRFRLSIKQADLVVIIPESEVFVVDRQSISRFGDVVTMERSVEEGTEVHGEAAGDAKVDVGLSKLSASAAASLIAKASRTAKETLKWIDKRAKIIVIYRYDNAENNDRWSFKPGTGTVLDGRPWDAHTLSLLRLVDKRANRRREVTPTVNLEIRCLREDLEIREIEIKNSSLWEKLRNRPGSENRLKAAEAYIKNQLEGNGHKAGNLGEKFAKIMIGHFIANRTAG
jgi:hypothetical protein